MNAQKHSNSEQPKLSTNCAFCDTKSLTQQLLFRNCSQLSTMLNTRYGKTIDKIVNSYHSPELIMCDDMYIYHEEDEYFKKIYAIGEYTHKIKLLSEYYKFHNEVPRIFILSITETLDDYIDEHRQMNYEHATRNMKKQQTEQKAETKPIPMKRLIDDINLSYEDFEQRNKNKQHQAAPKYQKNKKKLKMQIHSTELSKKCPLGSKILKPNKSSSKKKICSPTQINLNRNRSFKGLSRQKSKGNLQILNKPPKKKILTIHRGYVNSTKGAKHVHFKDEKQQSQKNQNPDITKRNGMSTARDRCNSKSIIKSVGAPPKTIGLKKQSHLKHKKSSLNIHRANNKQLKEDHTQPNRKISIKEKQRENSKDSNHLGASGKTNHFLSSQQSNSSSLNRQIFKSVQNILHGSNNSKGLKEHNL